MTIRELTDEELCRISGGTDDDDEVDEIVVVGTRANVVYYYNVSGGFAFGEAILGGGSAFGAVGIIGEGASRPATTTQSVRRYTLPSNLSPRAIRDINRIFRSEGGGGNRHEP